MMNQEQPSLIQAWMSTIRVRTLPIPTIQVVTGTALGYAVSGNLNLVLAFFTWLVAVFITFGTNLINDVFDYERGGDTEKRVGHKKMISAGLVSKRAVYAAGLTCLSLAILCAIPLAVYAGWIFLFLVVLSALMAYGYTGGPYPICYLGLSELFILLFYGFVLVGASFYIQAGFLSYASFLCSLQLGLLAILPNAMNNYRDIHDDAEVDKKTLAVRFGGNFAKREIAALTILPLVLCLFWIFLGFPLAAFLPLLLIPMAFLFMRSVWKTKPGPLFNKYFALSVIIHFCFGLLLTLGFLLQWK